jgi:hypothetical protein
MMQIKNCTKPPRPIIIHGLDKHSIRRVKVERNPKDGKIGIRPGNFQVPEVITILPGMTVDVPDAWAGCPDVVRYKRLKEIIVIIKPDPTEELMDEQKSKKKSKGTRDRKEQS